MAMIIRDDAAGVFPVESQPENSVNGPGRAPEPLKKEKERPIKMPKWWRQIEKIYNMIAGGTKFLFGFQSSISDIRVNAGQDIPKDDLLWVKGKGFISGAGIIFAIPNLIISIMEAVRAKDTIDKVDHVAKAITGAVRVAEAGVGIASGLKDFGLVAASSVIWVPYVSLVFSLLSLITVETDIVDMTKTRQFRREIKEFKSKKIDTTEKRIENLTNACQYVKENADKLYETLVITKKTEIDKRSDAILEKLKSANEGDREKGIQEGEEMMKTLRGRATTKLAVRIVSTVVKILTVAAAILGLFLLPTHVGWAIVIAASVVGLATFGFEKLMLNKDPFSKPKNVWHEKVAHDMRQWVHQAAKTVYKTSKKAVHEIKNFAVEADRQILSTVGSYVPPPPRTV